MSEQRFDPMKEISNLRNSLGKAIEQGIQTVTGIEKQIKLDIYELGDVVVIRTSPIDGLNPQSIEVSMENEILTISGETTPEETPANASYILQERRFGKFTRTANIPIPVQSTKAQAKLKHGVLTVTLPIDKGNYQNITVTPVD